MTIEIKIFGEAKDVISDMYALLNAHRTTTAPELISNVNAIVKDQAYVPAETKTESDKKEKPAKEKKAKEEKIETPKQEILEPEKLAYVLQDALDRAREIAGDGKDENVMQRLKSINTKLGISKVRELPADKIASYMVEVNKEFPLTAPAATADTNIF